MIKTRNKPTSVIENVVYYFTNKRLVGDNGQTTTMTGSTYNWDFPAPTVTEVEYGQESDEITLDDALDIIIARVYENKPAPTAMIEAVHELIKEIGIFFDINKVKNRELLTILCATLPSRITVPDNMVYHVLFYMLTGRTQYIRTFREFRHTTASATLTAKSLESFLRQNALALSKSFRRNRSLLLYIKKHVAGGRGRRMINDISRISRVRNKPVRVNKKSESLEAKTTAELCRMLYASNTITVRNGRKYTVEGRDKHPYDTGAILAILRTRDDVFTDEQLAMQEKGWTLAIPSSAKRATGVLPEGSYFPVKKGDTIGVKWYQNIDIDLSAIAVNGEKYGWNARKNGAFTYSGDMTHTVEDDNGVFSATEYFTINDPTARVYFDSVKFSGWEDDCKPVELFVGDEVIPLEVPETTQYFGFMEEGNFYLYNEKRGNTNITSKSSEHRGKSEFFYV